MLNYKHRNLKCDVNIKFKKYIVIFIQQFNNITLKCSTGSLESINY